MNLAETSPVLIKLKNNKVVRLLNVIYEKDGSIYFVFPRKKKYLISSIKKHEYGNSGIVNLETPDNQFITPKISFHPGKNVIHFIDENRNNIYSDFEVKSLNNDKFIIYFCQIILPKNLVILDEYKSNYQKYFTINESVLDNDECFCIEIMIHESDIFISEGNLPKWDGREFLTDTTFLGNNKYTCTFFISKFKNNNSEENGILINTNTKDCNIIYNIIPYE